MNKVMITLGQGDFELKSARITDNEVKVKFNQKRVVKGVTETFLTEMDGDVIPHPDLLAVRDTLKEYLMRSLNDYQVIEEARKYLKGEQLDKVESKFSALELENHVTGFTISGQDHLVGVIITGKAKNQMGGYSAKNSPRIVYSSDKLGYETDVQGQIELLERELFKYLFENKKANKDLFDSEEPIVKEPAKKKSTKGETMAVGKIAEGVVPMARA
jgi:hypothetical protein